MKKTFFAIICLLFSVSQASAGSLDELYRDLIKSDNEGYLPMFVKNRKAPDILTDKQISDSDVAQPAEAVVEETLEVNFVDPRKVKEEAEKAALQKWENTIKAIQQNNVSPVDLEEIITQSDKNNPKAIEIYAWMNTKGVGIKQNLLKAFELYQKAAKLGVANAENNAAQIYKVLSADQRAQLLNNH